MNPAEAWTFIQTPFIGRRALIGSLLANVDAGKRVAAQRQEARQNTASAAPTPTPAARSAGPEAGHVQDALQNWGSAADAAGSSSAQAERERQNAALPAAATLAPQSFYSGRTSHSFVDEYLASLRYEPCKYCQCSSL